MESSDRRHAAPSKNVCFRLVRQNESKSRRPHDQYNRLLGGIRDTRLEFGAALEVNKRVLVGRQDQLSFGQQALGFFGNQTPGSPPLPNELVSPSSRMPQLRSPAVPGGALTGAAGYYILLPFAGLLREGDGIGQVTVAVKWKVLGQSVGAPLGLAVRPHFDVPIKKGIDYLLTHPVGTADLQYGFDGILSRNFGDRAELYLNVGYRHIDQPVHVSVVQLPTKRRWVSGGTSQQPAAFNLSAKRRTKSLSAGTRQIRHSRRTIPWI